jgi:hypothetical protein
MIIDGINKSLVNNHFGLQGQRMQLYADDTADLWNASKFPDGWTFRETEVSGTPVDVVLRNLSFESTDEPGYVGQWSFAEFPHENLGLFAMCRFGGRYPNLSIQNEEHTASVGNEMQTLAGKNPFRLRIYPQKYEQGTMFEENTDYTVGGVDNNEITWTGSLPQTWYANYNRVQEKNVVNKVKALFEDCNFLSKRRVAGGEAQGNVPGAAILFWRDIPQGICDITNMFHNASITEAVAGHPDLAKRLYCMEDVFEPGKDGPSVPLVGSLRMRRCRFEGFASTSWIDGIDGVPTDPGPYDFSASTGRFDLEQSDCEFVRVGREADGFPNATWDTMADTRAVYTRNHNVDCVGHMAAGTNIAYGDLTPVGGSQHMLDGWTSKDNTLIISRFSGTHRTLPFIQGASIFIISAFQYLIDQLPSNADIMICDGEIELLNVPGEGAGGVKAQGIQVRNHTNLTLGSGLRFVNSRRNRGGYCIELKGCADTLIDLPDFSDWLNKKFFAHIHLDSACTDVIWNRLNPATDTIFDEGTGTIIDP